MTRDDIQTFVNKLMEAYERADERALSACYLEDATVESPMLGRRSGLEQIQGSFRDLFRVLSNWRITIDTTAIDPVNGRAVVLVTAQATHAGEMFGYPASRKRVTLRTALYFVFSRGRIASETRLYDFTGLLLQLGVLTAKGR